MLKRSLKAKPRHPLRTYSCCPVRFHAGNIQQKDILTEGRKDSRTKGENLTTARLDQLVKSPTKPRLLNQPGSESILQALVAPKLMNHLCQGEMTSIVINTIVFGVKTLNFFKELRMHIFQDGIGRGVDVGKRLMRYSQKSTKPHPVIGEILVNAYKIKTRNRDLGQVLAMEIFHLG